MVRVRPTIDEDMLAVRTLLREGFPNYPNWTVTLGRLLTEYDPPHGYLLEDRSVPVGVILSVRRDNRCSLSSWYVRPKYRCYAPYLVSQATQDRRFTYINVTPDLHTWPTVEAMRFERFADGQLVVPTLTGVRLFSTIRVIAGDVEPNAPFNAIEWHLVQDHMRYGWIGVWVVTRERAFPFVFRPRVVKRVIPSVQLVYCPDVELLVQFQQPLISWLAKHGKALLLIATVGPIRGLPGVFVGGAPRYYWKGDCAPRLGDLAYSEMLLFSTGPALRR